MREAQVTVKISNNIVGTATVREDGSIEMNLPKNQFGSELFLMLETGLSEGIRVALTMIPAGRGTIHLNGASNVQIGHGNVQTNQY